MKWWAITVINSIREHERRKSENASDIQVGVEFPTCQDSHWERGSKSTGPANKGAVAPPALTFVKSGSVNTLHFQSLKMALGIVDDQQ